MVLECKIGIWGNGVNTISLLSFAFDMSNGLIMYEVICCKKIKLYSGVNFITASLWD